MPRTILVTGGCGYLGSQLIREIALRSSTPVTIRIIDNLRNGQVRALMELPDRAAYELVEGDVLDPGVLRMALHGVDAVVHLAAVVRTPLTFENPAWLEQVNHWGTAQIVEAALAEGVERLIFPSTAAVYGPGGPHDESSVCRPQGPYAQSKYAAEKVLEAARERGLRPTILRLGTLFGLAPVIRFDAVANRFALKAGTMQPLTVYGDGQQQRPFVHVVDAAAAVVHALDNELPELRYNLVGMVASVAELARTIQHIAPSTVIHYTEQDILTHVSFHVDNRAILATGWEPQWSMEDGLAELIRRFTNLQRYMPYSADMDEL